MRASAGWGQVLVRRGALGCGGVFVWAGALAFGVGCGPPPGPAVAPLSTAAPVVATPSATVTVTEPPPKEILPALHPCVPEFIQKELSACPPGVPAADYSAVANAMAALTAAGPEGPRPKEKKPVPRELTPLEEKTEMVARAFLCQRPPKKGKGTGAADAGAGGPRGGAGAADAGAGGLAAGTTSPDIAELNDEYATALFDLGRLYLNANHFEEALFFLYDATLLDPQKYADVEYAARFLVDSARPLSDSRPECVDIVAALIQAVQVHICGGPGADQRKETCEALAAKASPPPTP